jgi:alkanesulfonate monooxygenase SsuD/methylene tetrahydromethanopterin reductase-like flavin-dependent oxidoreductase (luciferase family)
MGPKTLRLSGELASGTVFTAGTTPEALRSAIEHIRAGRASGSEHRGRSHTIAAYVPCTTGPTARQELLDEIAYWGFDPDSDVGVCGDVEEIAVGVQRWVQAGVDTVLLQPTARAPIEQFVRFVGREVRPGIQGWATLRSS